MPQESRENVTAISISKIANVGCIMLMFENVVLCYVCSGIEAFEMYFYGKKSIVSNICLQRTGKQGRRF
jgi:hypothetical protein